MQTLALDILVQELAKNQVTVDAAGYLHYQDSATTHSIPAGKKKSHVLSFYYYYYFKHVFVNSRSFQSHSLATIATARI